MSDEEAWCLSSESQPDEPVEPEVVVVQVDVDDE